jgi:hypothetical protein
MGFRTLGSTVCSGSTVVEMILHDRTDCRSPQFGHSARQLACGVSRSASPMTLMRTPHLQRQVATVLIMMAGMLHLTRQFRYQTEPDSRNRLSQD